MRLSSRQVPQWTLCAMSSLQEILVQIDMTCHHVELLKSTENEFLTLEKARSSLEAQCNPPLKEGVLLETYCMVYWYNVCAASQASVAPIPAERSLAYWTFLRLLICAGRLQWVAEQKAADITGWFAAAGHKSSLDEKSFIAELKVLVQDNGKEMQSTQNCM